MNKPKLGDRFFLVKDHYRTPETSTVYVKKVGRKYFWVGVMDPMRDHKHLWTKFHISTYLHAEEYGSYTLYKSEQEYLDRIEAKKLFAEIDRTYFKFSLADSVTLDKLKRIKAILEEE